MNRRVFVSGSLIVALSVANLPALAGKMKNQEALTLDRMSQQVKVSSWADKRDSASLKNPLGPLSYGACGDARFFAALSLNETTGFMSPKVGQDGLFDRYGVFQKEIAGQTPDRRFIALPIAALHEGDPYAKLTGLNHLSSKTKKIGRGVWMISGQELLYYSVGPEGDWEGSYPKTSAPFLIYTGNGSANGPLRQAVIENFESNPFLSHSENSAGYGVYPRVTHTPPKPEKKRMNLDPDPIQVTLDSTLVVYDFIANQIEQLRKRAKKGDPEALMKVVNHEQTIATLSAQQRQLEENFKEQLKNDSVIKALRSDTIDPETGMNELPKQPGETVIDIGYGTDKIEIILRDKSGNDRTFHPSTNRASGDQINPVRQFLIDQNGLQSNLDRLNSTEGSPSSEMLEKANFFTSATPSQALSAVNTLDFIALAKACRSDLELLKSMPDSDAKKYYDSSLALRTSLDALFEKIGLSSSKNLATGDGGSVAPGL